jgi:hypothetical protein
MNIEEKRKFIYDNLKYINDKKNNIIYEYILNNNLKHSFNKNGLIINLSIITENDINNLYDIINKNEINKNLCEFDDIEIYKTNICTKIIKKPILKKYKNIKLNKLDLKILSYI